MHNRGYDSKHGASSSPTTAHRAEDGGECTAVLGTMTNALQAQRALANATIYASVIKISSSQSAKGCTYGISYPCSQDHHVRMVLSNADIHVKKYMGG